MNDRRRDEDPRHRWPLVTDDLWASCARCGADYLNTILAWAETLRGPDGRIPNMPWAVFLALPCPGERRAGDYWAPGI